MSKPTDPSRTQTQWFRFGLLLAVLHLVFLTVVVVLLQRNVALAIGAAVAGGILFVVFVYAAVGRLEPVDPR